MRRLILLALVVAAAAACGPAPGYDANGQFVADPNAGLTSPRRGPAPAQAAPAQTSGGQQAPAGAQPQAGPQGDPAFYDNLSAASGSGAQPQPRAACDDSCRFANNGECDDGREGSDTDVCPAGTDCADCGG